MTQEEGNPLPSSLVNEEKKEEIKEEIKVEKATANLKEPEIIKTINATGEQAMKLMDAEDEKAIVNAELFDATINSLVYQASGLPLSLTITGVMESARRFKNIKTGTLKIVKGKDSVVAYAYAHNLKDNLYVELAVEQPIKVNGVVDKFALVKAQSKAIRNCIKKVVPVNHFRAMIELYVKKKKAIKTK